MYYLIFWRIGLWILSDVETYTSHADILKQISFPFEMFSQALVCLFHAPQKNIRVQGVELDGERF